MAAGIGNNPALYAMYKAAGLLDNVAGGVEFSVPLVMGSGSAQTFNVANIIKSLYGKNKKAFNLDLDNTLWDQEYLLLLSHIHNKQHQQQQYQLLL